MVENVASVYIKIFWIKDKFTVDLNDNFFLQQDFI